MPRIHGVYSFYLALAQGLCSWENKRMNSEPKQCPKDLPLNFGNPGVSTKTSWDGGTGLEAGPALGFWTRERKGGRERREVALLALLDIPVEGGGFA